MFLIGLLFGALIGFTVGMAIRSGLLFDDIKKLYDICDCECIPQNVRIIEEIKKRYQL